MSLTCGSFRSHPSATQRSQMRIASARSCPLSRTFASGTSYVYAYSAATASPSSLRVADGVMLQRTVHAPPLHLEPRGFHRVEPLPATAGQRVETGHQAARSLGIVAGIRSPELIRAEHKPGAPERLRPWQPKPASHQPDRRRKHSAPLATVVADPGRAFHLREVDGVERPDRGASVTLAKTHHHRFDGPIRKVPPGAARASSQAHRPVADTAPTARRWRTRYLAAARAIRRSSREGKHSSRPS